MHSRVHNRVTSRQDMRLHGRGDALKVPVRGDVQLLWLVGVLGHLCAGAVIAPLVGRRALSLPGALQPVLVLA